MTEQEMQIALAEARGWVWYRTPKLPSDNREHRLLAHPAIHEYPEQSECWLVRADGTERMCNMEYMEREGHVPKLTLDEIAHARKDLLTTPHLRVHFVEWLHRIASHYDLFVYGWHLVDAPAKAQCEAILRTLNKWKE